MATSSIFADFSIKDKKTAENFFSALEKSEKMVKNEKQKEVDYCSISDPKQIRELINKRKERL